MSFLGTMSYKTTEKLLAKFINKAKEKRQALAPDDDQCVTDTNEFIERLESGEAALEFVDDLKRYGMNEKGERLRFTPALEEYARLIADFRVAETYITGIAQFSKSLLNIELNAWLVTKGNLNTVFVFAAEMALNRMIPIQVKPIFNEWIKAFNIKLKANEGSKNNRLIQIKKGNANFAHVGTGGPSNGGGAAASKGLVSFSVDVAFCDEFSQYPSGSADQVYRRLDNSRIKTQPVRALGTPGNSQGIEALIEKADHHFYVHNVCPHCGELIALHPFGCLLKPKEIVNSAGEKEISYLSASGKPDSWFYHDESDPVGSAYFGCPSCGGEIDDETRRNAHYRCLYTKDTLEAFLDNLETDSGKRHRVGLSISPLMRISKINLAAELIRNGLESGNPADFCQQRLGVPSTADSANIPLSKIKAAIYAPYAKPSNQIGAKTIRVAGIDQGRSNDYMWINEYHLPLNWESLSVNEVLETTIRNTLLGEPVVRNDIPDILDKYEVEHGFIDNEPDRAAAAELAERTVLMLADQKPRLLDAIKPGTVFDGGMEIPCYGIRNAKFLRQVKQNFLLSASDGNPLIRLPESWERWLNVSTEMSPVRHLRSLSFDHDSGKFIREPGHVDDLYYALMFAEACFYWWIETGCQADTSWLNML